MDELAVGILFGPADSTPRHADRAWRRPNAQSNSIVTSTGPTWSGGCSIYRLGRHEDAIADLRKACELNPKDALALHALAYGEVIYGDGPSAKEHLLQCLRLSPRDPWRYNACVVLGNACTLTGDYVEGLKWVEESRREHPNFVPAIAVGLKLHVALGQIERARHEANLLKQLSPAQRRTHQGGHIALSSV